MFICPLARFLLLDDTDSSLVNSSRTSSPRSRALVVVGPVDRREVEMPLVGALGSGALLGGSDVALKAGEELCMVRKVMRVEIETRLPDLMGG